MNPQDLDALMREHGWIFQFGTSDLPHTRFPPSRVYRGTHAAAPRTGVANLLMLAGLRVIRPDLTTSNQIHVFI